MKNEWEHILLKISFYEVSRDVDMYVFQAIHRVLWAWMDCLITYSKVSLVSAYSTLIMLPVLKPNFLNFNEMCPNVTSMTK